MDKFEKQILEHLSTPGYFPLKPGKLAAKLKLSKKLIPKHEAALNRLVEAGRVLLNKNGKLTRKPASRLVAGIIKRTSSGAAYLIPHDDVPELNGSDVYIARTDVHDAHTGDEVLVSLLKRRRSGGQRTGRVEEVTQRATSTFVGTYFESDGRSYVKLDGKMFEDPILVGDPGAKGACEDDKVVIEMLRFPTNYRPGEGVLTNVLGPRGSLGVDTLSIIHEFGLPDEFPDDVLEEARTQADAFDETDLRNRRDLTGDTIVTIDPADARDFDDAISLSRSEDGHWHLGVHIADVSHFVKPGTRLGEEARLRGNSVYLPRHVIPMLPEVISNGLASLQKGKVRYTKSAFIEFTAEGIPVHTEFANTAIKVTRRFAYEEVMPIIENPEKHKARVSAKVCKLLSRMHELAMILRKRRFQAGYLNLAVPEVAIDFDKNGTVTGAHEAFHDESHEIIEEFMLAANIAVATKLSDLEHIFLRRVHPNPEPAKLRRFAEFVTAMGYPLEKYESREALQSILARVRGEPAERAVNYSLLRSMKQAEYSALPLGHYALAADNYCHFTSPIRRYPDLLIHRLLNEIVTARGKPKNVDELELIKSGKHCSTTERTAARAERELKKIKLLTYMVKRVGDEMDAFITGVEKFGVFCQCVEIPAEGLVHISALGRDDNFYYDETTFSLIGRRTGTEYRLGDRVRVVVARVDVDRRVLDFRMATGPPSKSTNKSKKTGRVKRSGSKKSTSKNSASKRAPSKRSAASKRSSGKGKTTGRARKSGGGKKRGAASGTSKRKSTTGRRKRRR